VWKEKVRSRLLRLEAQPLVAKARASEGAIGRPENQSTKAHQLLDSLKRKEKKDHHKTNRSS
jgi:hypothetical protein